MTDKYIPELNNNDTLNINAGAPTLASMEFIEPLMKISNSPLEERKKSQLHLDDTPKGVVVTILDQVPELNSEQAEAILPPADISSLPMVDLPVLTWEQAEERFHDLWNAGPSLHAYFNDQYVVFVDYQVSDKDIKTMDEAGFVHISFSRFPGKDGWINTFRLLMDNVFKNAAVLESNDRVNHALLLEKQKA